MWVVLCTFSNNWLAFQEWNYIPTLIIIIRFNTVIDETHMTYLINAFRSHVLARVYCKTMVSCVLWHDENLRSQLVLQIKHLQHRTALLGLLMLPIRNLRKHNYVFTWDNVVHSVVCLIVLTYLEVVRHWSSCTCGR